MRSASPMDRVREGTGPEITRLSYQSMILPRFLQAFSALKNRYILDIGPVCGENINFLGRRAPRIYICDMYRRLARRRAGTLEPPDYWGHLDYPPGGMGGIVVWDLADRFEDQEAPRLVENLWAQLCPGGLVMVSALSERSFSQEVNSFVLGSDSLVTLRPQPRLSLPRQARPNRDFLALFEPFVPVKTVFYRNGIREFLFTKP